MKKILLTAAVMAIIIATASVVFADQADVSVTATVASKCTVNAGSFSNAAMGAIALDPENVVAASGTQTWAAVLKCTKGYALPAISFSSANSYFLVNGGDSIQYSASAEWRNGGVAQANGLGFSAGKDLDLGVTVDIGAAAYSADSTAGDYTDTLTVTFTP